MGFLAVVQGGLGLALVSHSPSSLFCVAFPLEKASLVCCFPPRTGLEDPRYQAWNAFDEDLNLENQPGYEEFIRTGLTLSTC